MKKKKKISSHRPLIAALTTRKNIFKVSATAFAVILSLSIALPSVADEGEIEYVKASPEIVNAPTESSQKVSAEAASCADINNPLGLGYAQAMAVGDMKTMIATPINTDKMFNPGEAGCFDALKDFPNLSMTIPSLTDIGNALQGALVKYATRKVCNTVNDSLTELINPLNEVMDEVSTNGKIDLTGTVNKEIYKELYEIDPALGRQMTKGGDAYTWKSPTFEEMAENSKGIIAGISNDGGFTEPKAPNENVATPSTPVIQEEEPAPKKTITESAKAVISSIF